MWAEHAEAELEDVDESVAPPASRHLRRQEREPVRQFVVQSEHDRSLAWKVPIQEPRAHARPGCHLPEGGRLVPTIADQADGRFVETETVGLPFSRPPCRSPPFRRLAIFSKHVYY